MWGSLSLGSIRDAAAKIKDGLEAQMEEAVQQAGPKVTRSSTIDEPSSPDIHTASCRKYQEAPSPSADGSVSPSRETGATSLLSPLSRVPGLQGLPSRLGAVVGGGEFWNGVDGSTQIDDERGYGRDPVGDYTDQLLPSSPPLSNSTDPDRNTPMSGFFGNPVEENAVGEVVSPAVRRVSRDERFTRREKSGAEGAQESGGRVRLSLLEAGGVPGLEEAFTGKSGRSAKQSIAGEGWGDIALDSDDDLDILDTTASAETSEGVEKGTVDSGFPEAGGPKGRQSQAQPPPEGLPEEQERDRNNDHDISAAKPEIGASEPVLPWAVRSSVANDGDGGIDDEEEEDRGKPDGATEAVPTPSLRIAEDDEEEYAADAGVVTATAASGPPDEVRAFSSPVVRSQQHGQDQEGEKDKGCPADGDWPEKVDPWEKGTAAWLRDQQKSSKETRQEDAGREKRCPPSEGEEIPETMAEAPGGEVCQEEEGRSRNAKGGIMPSAPVPAPPGASTKAEEEEEEEKAGTPMSTIEPNTLGSDQSPSGDGIVCVAAAAPPVGLVDVIGAVAASTATNGSDRMSEVEARRRRAAAAAAERRRLASGSPASVTEGRESCGAAPPGGERIEANLARPEGDSGENAQRRSAAETRDLTAALVASREREDALTARLLMAEELLAERERQLESTNISMAEMMQNGEHGGGDVGGERGRASVAVAAAAAAAEKEAVSRERREAERGMTAVRERHRTEVSRLEGVLEAERKKAKAAAEAMKGWERRAEEFEEKDKMLQAYMEEGQALAYKQSEMEKSVRKARGSLRGVTEEKDALAKEKQALEVSLAGLREQLRARDEERATQTQSLAAMGAVSQASTQKLTTAEKELEKTREALSAKKMALDKAWGEIKDLKRSVAELKAGKDALSKSLEDGGKARQVTESQLKEWQARENSLLLEQGQLQETLERVRREADMREDEANKRQEDVRRRWKDAVARAEALQAEAHESTAPLLRQIRALQQEMRLRQEAVRAAEGALNDRASISEQACREEGKRRRAAEATAAVAEETAHRAEGEAEALKSKVEQLEASNEDLKAKCHRYMQRVSELEGEVSAAREASKASALAHKATETKLRLQVNDSEERLQEAQRKAEMERRDAKDAATTLREQIEEMRRNQGRGFFGAGGRRDSASSFSVDDRFGDGFRSGPGASSTPRGGAVKGGGGGGGGAIITFAEVERLQSLVRQKEGQVAVLQQRLEEMHAVRDALTEEVTSLGRRNTELEALAKAAPILRDQALDLQHKNTVLLDLLGEKTEELEAMQSDMKEVQSMYRAQYDELLSRASMGAGPGTTAV